MKYHTLFVIFERSANSKLSSAAKCRWRFSMFLFQLFDSFVVVASFIADLYFIDGLTNYPLESFVLILALMVPWRVIRVLNSEYTGNP